MNRHEDGLCWAEEASGPRGSDCLLEGGHCLEGGTIDWYGHRPTHCALQQFSSIQDRTVSLHLLKRLE